jgi:Matrixin/PEP-CTERM motif
MPAGYMSEITAALNAWSSVANLTFTMVIDDGAAVNAATTSGQLRFGGHAFGGAGGTLAHGFYPPINGSSIAGDMHFDTADTWKTSFGGSGFSLFQVTAHELGHALGLYHTEVANSLMNEYYTEAFSGPQADDIAGMQYLYGAAVAVPEPGTWAMMGLGLAALATRRRRVR